MGISPAEVIAVGDGANDSDDGGGGLSIAYHPPEARGAKGRP